MRRPGDSTVMAAHAVRGWAALILIIGHSVFCVTGDVLAQDSLGVFDSDPIRFFIDQPGDTWVGNGRFFMVDYSDTLVIKPDSTGEVLAIRRTLVKSETGQVISRGSGTLTREPGAASYAVTWSERRYTGLTGTMRRVEGQWRIGINGEWSAWSVQAQGQSADAFVASLSRSLGSFPSVEIARLTYQLVAPAE